MKSIFNKLLLVCIMVAIPFVTYAEESYLIKVSSKDPAQSVHFMASNLVTDNKGSIMSQYEDLATPYEFRLKANFVGFMMESLGIGENTDLVVQVSQDTNGQEKPLSSAIGHAVFGYNGKSTMSIIAQ
jgi:hypothetical protein